MEYQTSDITNPTNPTNPTNSTKRAALCCAVDGVEGNVGVGVAGCGSRGGATERGGLDGGEGWREGSDYLGLLGRYGG